MEQAMKEPMLEINPRNHRNFFDVLGCEYNRGLI